MTQTTLTFGPEFREVAVGDVVRVATAAPVVLDCGETIQDFPMAYQAYGKLNADKSNAILVCHGLTADQYAASDHPVTDKPGWWSEIIGPGKPLDTDRYYVICPNVLGGCLGSYGPKSEGEDGKPLALDFPIITIRDMVRAQKALIDALGISHLFAVIGASMGGMQALTWATDYPDFCNCVLPIASAARHTAQNIAFHEIGRQSIMADPDWREGKYLNEKAYPSKGLAVARMTAHVTYMSQAALAQKFGRQLQDKDALTYGFDADFQIESYLRHQGAAFVSRFDPNSYLYITRAMDYFDMERDYGQLSDAFKDTKAAFCVVSFSSDWCFPTEESKRIVRALAASAIETSFVEIQSDKGHDAFLLDEPDFAKTLSGFLTRHADKLGV